MAMLARAIIVLISGFVVIRLLPLIWIEFTGGDGCPDILMVPACLIVAVCYTLMAIAAIVGPPRLLPVFLTGWVPVFGLAFVGSALEVMGTDTCPKSSSGMPLCYYSLALACVLAVLYFVARRGAIQAAK